MTDITPPQLSQLAAEKANRGLLFQQEGKLEEAIAFYREALAVVPRLPLVHYNLGIALHHLGDLPGARTHYQEAIALNPDDTQGIYNLAVVLQQQGLLEAAIHNYQEVINLSPSKDLIKVKAYSNWGGILIGQGKFNEAIEIFEKAIALQPEDATLYNNLGQGFLEAGKIERAIATYQQALELDPQLIVARHNLGKAYQKKGLHWEAIAYFQQVIERQPNNIFANSDCGYSFLEEGKLLEAMASFHKVVKNNPFVEGYCQKAKKLTGEDELEKAKIACALFLEAINLQDFQKNSPVEQASCLFPKKPGFWGESFWGDYLGLTYYYLGNVSFEYGEYQQAETYYKKALKIQPLNVELYLTLAKSLVKQKRVKAAITVCHWALTIQPDNLELEKILKTIKQKNLQEKGNPKSGIGIINLSKLEDRQDARSTLLKKEKIECKGLNCEPCLQRINKYFEPIHIGHNIYAFSQIGSTIQSPIELSSEISQPSTFVSVVPNGRAWIVPQKNSWMVCNAVAIINEENQLLAEVSREYPGQLPGCQNYDINKHRIFSQEELPALEKIEGTVAVLSGLSGNVYFHWMVDILPRLEILRLNGVNFEEIDRFLINSYQQEFQRKTLRTLGIPEDKIIESDRHPYIQADKLIVPSYPGDLGWLPKWGLEFHRREFLNVEQASCLFPNSHPDTASYPERIYISRNRARHRRVLNEEEVIDLLSKHGFKVIVPESITWEEQIALFANAKVVVSPHGSGLTNIMFSQPGTTVIELFSPHYIRHYYWVISQQLGLDHYYLKGEGFPCYPIRELMYPNPLTEDILVNLNYLEEMMNRTSTKNTQTRNPVSINPLTRNPVSLRNRVSTKTSIIERDSTARVNFPKRTASDNKSMQSQVNPTEAAIHYNDRAQLFLKQKKLDEAKAACEQALKNQPDFAPACKTMGNILQAGGRADEAWEWYSKAVAIQPDFAEAYTNMGTLYAQRQEWKEAIAYFQKAIALKPNLAPAHRNLARAYEKIGQKEAAAESRQQALSLEGQTEARPIQPERNRVSGAADFSPQLKSQEQPSHILSNSNISAIGLPADALLAYKQLGLLLQGQGKVEEAWQWYRKAIAISPNDPEIYLNLGILYGQQQQWYDAIKCYKKSLKLQPNFAEGYRKLATALTQVGQQQEAAEYWYRAYSIEPQKATAEEHLILGNTLLRQNLINQAISCYCRAIELNPNLKGAYENLGEALQRQGKQYQEKNQLGLGFQQEWGRQPIPEEILQKAEQLKQTASNLMMYEVPGMENDGIIKPGQLSKANIVREALRHFDRVLNELVNSVAFAFNLKHDVPLSYLESSLPIRSNNYLLSPRISYPEKPEFKVEYPPANRQQPLVTVEPNLSDTYWNLSGMKSDWELGMEPDIPPETRETFGDKGDKGDKVALTSPLSPPSPPSPSANGWASVKPMATQRSPVAPGPKGETTINLAELHVQRALAYFAKGVWEQAIAECERAIAMKPDLAAAYSVLGNALKQSGKLAEAEKNYSKAIALDPNDATVLANLGNLYAEEQKWQQAIPYYQEAIALRPNFAGAYRNLAKAWTQVGKSAEAADCWYQAYTLEPQNVSYNQFFNLANTLYRQGQISQAVWCYRQAIQLNPNYAAAYHNLGSALKRQGKLDESTFCYEKAKELNGGPLVSKKVRTNSAGSPLAPLKKGGTLEDRQQQNGSSQGQGNPEDILTSSNRQDANRQDAYSTSPVANNENWLEKARDFLGQKQFEEAIAAGKLAIKITPQAEAYLIMGQAWQGMDKAEEAIGFYERAIELNPDLRDAYHGLVGALQQVGKTQEAEELSYKALIEHPDWFTAEEFCTLGKNYLAEGKTEKSVGCYRQAIQLNSQLWEAYFGLGQISTNQQQWEEAVGYYRQAVELNSKSTGSYYGLGQALAEKGEWQEAIACYQKVIELNSNLGGNQPEENIEIWEVYNRLGDGLQELGQIEEAVEAYRKAIELAEK